MPAYTGKGSAPDQDLKDIYAYLKSVLSAQTGQDIPLLNKIKERQ